MKRTLLSLVLFALPLVLLASCSDEEDGPPLVLQQEDRDRITDMAGSYVAALRARDMTAAQSHLTEGVPAATITKAMDTVEDEGFAFVAVSGIEPSHSDGATAWVVLTDKSGEQVSREIEFRLIDGEWRVYSPHLKES